MTAERQRMLDDHWKKWGPYVSNRQWGTVREDYSHNGNAVMHCRCWKVRIFSISMNFTNLGYNLQVASTGTRQNTVEGWGKLMIPNKTFTSVLKLKSVSDHDITVTYEGNSTTQNVREVSYQWFSKDSKVPVLTVTGTETNGIFVPANAQYLYFPDLGISETENDKKLLIYPNPVRNVIKTDIPEKDIVSIKIYDANGRMIGNSLDVSLLTQGNYILRISTKDKLFEGKFIKR